MNDPQGPQDWEAESDMHTLTRAKEIAKDPSRVSRAKAYAMRKAAELKAIAGPELDDDAGSQLAGGFRKLK